MDGDDAQPGEDRVAIGPRSQEERPCGLAGVLDELARRVDDVGHGTLQVAVVAAVKVFLVAARDLRTLGKCRFGSGLHEPRPGRGRPGRQR